MLDTEEINKEIARLEWEESSYPNYQKLASLYTIKNQILGNTPRLDAGYAMAAAPEPQTAAIVAVDDTSEFLHLINGKDADKVWAIMDELMSTLQVVNERVYNRVLDKIDRI